MSKVARRSPDDSPLLRYATPLPVHPSREGAVPWLEAVVVKDVGMAADIGTLARLPKIIGSQSIVRELALTGRSFGAAEAKEIGFVSTVVNGGQKEVLGGL